MTAIHYQDSASSVICRAKMAHWDTNPDGWDMGTITVDVTKVTCPDCRSRMGLQPIPEHVCDARPVTDGGDLQPGGYYGAPGSGQAWDCQVCGTEFARIGPKTWVPASMGAHLLDPADVI